MDVSLDPVLKSPGFTVHGMGSEGQLWVGIHTKPPTWFEQVS